ncbi:Hypothetical protein CINCED_3A011708 [Cinara cedri]|uniref:Uncharacterized protein n=1 Tax=Cinara cedri TaxID=506608 RepID=A0A5E4MNB2_9HEMI|nr:Hypothetical protein CINCED_3A011708 [Cinara cedri]
MMTSNFKVKKFEKMIRGDPVSEQVSYKKQIIDVIKFNELEDLKQCIFVNSLSYISDDVLREKCQDIITHYRLFKDDESHYQVKELSDDEKAKVEKCIGVCIQKECARIIREKESIPSDLFKLIESDENMLYTLSTKLNNMVSLLNKYTSNQREISNSIFRLLDSSSINIIEAQELSKHLDVIKANSHKLQNNIIAKFPCSDALLISLEKYYNAKKIEYTDNLAKLEDLKKLQGMYKQVDGPQYRTLIKKFIQTQEIIKIKTDMFNSC